MFSFGNIICDGTLIDADHADFSTDENPRNRAKFGWLWFDNQHRWCIVEPGAVRID